MNNQELKEMLGEYGNPTGIITILANGSAMRVVGTVGDGLPDDLADAIKYVEEKFDVELEQKHNE